MELTNAQTDAAADVIRAAIDAEAYTVEEHIDAAALSPAIEARVVAAAVTLHRLASVLHEMDVDLHGEEPWCRSYSGFMNHHPLCREDCHVAA